jgi:hypothetical protein
MSRCIPGSRAADGPLTLLLAHIAESACHATWPQLRREFDRINVGAFTGSGGTFRQRTEITKTPARHLRPAPGRPAAADLPAHPPLDPDQHEHPVLDAHRPPMPQRVPARRKQIYRLSPDIDRGTLAD